MSNQLFRKADPRLLRAIRSSQGDEGIIAAVLDTPGVVATEDEIELLVSVSAKPELGGKWSRIEEGLYSAIIPPGSLEELARRPEVQAFEPPRPMAAATLSSIAAINVRALHEAPLTRTGKGVVIAILDFGLDFKAIDFRTPDGRKTRIKWLWDQDLQPNEREHSPEQFGYGVEYSEADINLALGAQGPNPVRHIPRQDHGTMVTGIAASSARQGTSYLGVAPDADLIFVNLGQSRRRPANNEGPQNITNSIRVAEALRWVFDKVAEMRVDGRVPPCVVNMSISQNLSSHDGESLVEQEIDRLLDRSLGRAIVVAAGNDGADSLHAQWKYTPGQSTEILMNVPATHPWDLPCELEAWFSSRDAIEISVKPPNGTFSEPIRSPFDKQVSFGNTTGYVLSQRFETRGGDARVYVSLGENNTAVAKGEWTFRFRALEGSHEGVLHAWIERTGRPSQPRFVNAGIGITIGSPATARRCISVGNADQQRAAVPNSGQGPTRDGRSKPELIAPGTAVMSCTATAKPQRAPGNGTSFSAPHVTGIIACLFEEDRELSPPQIQKLLTAASDGAAFDAAQGYGFVDAKKALDLMREEL